MITSLRMVNFKNFANETLRLGPFTVIVGANASGKSNIRDAFRFLHGIGRGYTLAEIMGGKYGADWKPLRGAPNEIIRLGSSSGEVWPSFSLDVELDMSWGNVSYSVGVGHSPNIPDQLRVLTEELGDYQEGEYAPVFKAHHYGEGNSVIGLEARVGDQSGSTLMSGEKPALSTLAWRPGNAWSRLRLAFELEEFLGSMRFVELVPDRMREPSMTISARLGDSGDSLASVLEDVFSNVERKNALLSWLHDLSPMDVVNLEFPRDPSGRVHLQIVERSGRKVSAYSASDGTLRFLGLLAVLFGEHQKGFYFFEEIDNGIHPNRLWLLLDLIERQTAKGEMQVITTTHSPALLSWLRDKTFENTSLVYRDGYWADSVIRPIADLYDLRELRKSVALGELHTEGWFEQAMKSKEGDHDTDHLDDDDEEGDVPETDG